MTVGYTMCSTHSIHQIDARVNIYENFVGMPNLPHSIADRPT